MFPVLIPLPPPLVVFFFNDTATTEIYTLSLHDALPISARRLRAPSACRRRSDIRPCPFRDKAAELRGDRDRKSTRLNSSHGYISYAVFCLKKKKHPNSLQGERHCVDGILPASPEATHDS